MYWYFKALRKYADFNGRAGRKEYWLYVLFNVIISLILSGLDEVAGLTTISSGGLGPLYGVYSLAVLIPSLAVTVRRLHDVGKSGWWLLLAFVPLLGVILLIFLALAGEAGRNEYGDDPRSSPENSRWANV